MITKLHGIDILLNLLRSPSFEAKKTACLALSEVLRGGGGIHQKLIEKGGVMVLVELVSDEEEDEELSNKAY